MLNNIVVVTPTYNEKENIVKLIDEIDRLKLPIDIVVVDDNSPDGTGPAAESMKKTKPNLEVIHRKKKEGLGPAYIQAFRYVLDKGKYDYIVHMDADFSHNPKCIPELLEAARRRGDVVVGSRYAKGGGISEAWNALRKFLSRFANLYARLVTGLRLNDCTSGFRCFKKEALKSIDFNKRFLNGYGFLVQMLYEAKKNNLTICEVPIFFDERTRGTSKMTVDIMLEAFFSLMFMKIRDIFIKQ